MNVEHEIKDLKQKVANLQQIVMQTARNNNPVVEQIDSMAGTVKMLTPYTETKTAYLGDTEVSFTDVPSGNLSVYVTDENGNYPDFSVDRNGDTITVYFEPLEYITKITISIS